MKINKQLIISLFFLPLGKGFAQDKSKNLGPLITDRPDATESASTVPVGYIQVETGTFYESFKEDNVNQKAYTFNTTLLRIGLIENVELRLGSDFREEQTEVGGYKLAQVSSGYSPLLLGTKIRVAAEKGFFPEIGFLGHVYLPFSAGTDYKPETTGVDFRFAFAHTLSEDANLSYNLGAEWNNDSSEAAYVYTISYGHRVTEKLGLYAELYGDMPENNTANHFWDAGLTYLLSDNFQLDATIGTSITKGQDILLSAGFSFRLPLKKQN